MNFIKQPYCHICYLNGLLSISIIYITMVPNNSMTNILFINYNGINN